MDIEQTVARAIAIARQDTGMTAAEFDRHIAISGVGGAGGATPDTLGAGAALINALWLIAAEDHPQGTPGRVELVGQAVSELRERIQPALDAYVTRCRNRTYTG